MNAAAPAVVLVHGLWMTVLPDMVFLSRRLRRCGFRVHEFRYPTVTRSLAQNAAELNRFLQKVPGETVHLVGHSLGGLVIRRLLLDHPQQRPGRVVTLGTPHHTSAVARRLGRNRPGRVVLGLSHGALTEELPPWNGGRELGTLAGDRPYGLGRLLRCLPKPNDGTVAVSEALLDEAADRLVLPVSHMSMLVSAPAVEALCRFLHTGRF